MFALAPRSLAARQSVQLQRWRTLTPLLYDWLASSNRTWPSLTCRWGKPALAFNASAAGDTRSRQRLYWSEQTDGSVPNTLIAANVDVTLPRCASAEAVVRAMSDSGGAATFRKGKTVYHPGEVNKIREVNGAPAELVITASDAPEVYVWNLGTQSDRTGDARKDELSQPDCLLTGHSDDASFALATAAKAPAVASGGKDKDACVCLWNLRDAEGNLLDASGAAEAAATASAGRTSLNSGGLGGLSATTTSPSRLACRVRFVGHSKTVEDVTFHPSSEEQLCSVGDDSCICFWDVRTGTAPVIKVRACCPGRRWLPCGLTPPCTTVSTARTPQLEGAHGTEDIHCCAWAIHDEALVVTGSADSTVRLFDRRRAGSGAKGATAALMHTFQGHTDAVNVVQWCPDRGGVLASASADGMVNVWDATRIGAPGAAGGSDPPLELLFQHAGHAGAPVVDFHWSPAVPWTCVSVSDNPTGGGTIQVWRMSDLLHRPEADVLEELEKHRESILAARAAGAPAAGSAGGDEEDMDEDDDAEE